VPSKKPRVRSQTRPSRIGQETPEYEVEKSGKVGNRVEILGVELLHVHFGRQDEGPLGAGTSFGLKSPTFGVQPEWKVSQDGTILGCEITFGTIFEDPEPYSLVAAFRLTYSIPPGTSFAADEINNFVHWNAVFNAWPYWREYLSSTINRANLPRFIAPVMRLPLGSSKSTSK
jgi:hypothetical protein